MKNRFSVFWVFVGALLASAVWFAANVEFQRRGWNTFRLSDNIDSGAEVVVDKVIDGDEVSVKSKSGDHIIARLLGIKCFTPGISEAGIGAAGEACVNELSALVLNKPAKLVFNGPLRRDSRGRVLAYLHVGPVDVGEELLAHGRAMVYVRYGFDREERYLEVEQKAREARRGLWGNRRAKERALALQTTWRAERTDP